MTEPLQEVPPHSKLSKANKFKTGGRSYYIGVEKRFGYPGLPPETRSLHHSSGHAEGSEIEVEIKLLDPKLNLEFGSFFRGSLAMKLSQYRCGKIGALF